VGYNQREAAEFFKVAFDLYKDWERGRKPIPIEWQRATRRTLSSLKEHEWCVLMRRRSKLSLALVAQQSGFCRQWVNDMELGKQPCGSLVKYWYDRGNQQ
jgi:hypothetical protein